jgi:hypothetical protein
VLLAAVDLATTQANAQGLEHAPWPYFLALVVGAVGILWAAYTTAMWAGARREREMAKRLHEEARMRGDELKRERDELQGKLADERRENLKLTVEIITVGKGLVRVQEELDREAIKRGLGKRHTSNPETPKP